MSATRSTFQASLDELEALLHEQGDVVLKMLGEAGHALAAQDPGRANKVLGLDDQADDLYLRIERGVEQLLARQTPVAVDLRLVLAVLHDNFHLERMGDQCVNIAKLTKLIAGLDLSWELQNDFGEMTSQADKMIRIALESFASRDAATAESLTDLDEVLDNLNREVAAEVLAQRESVSSREAGLRAIMIARCFERIGDNAVDIGEQTVYLVTGEFREFTDASHPTG
jgi:phosphate transport system protein